jgi:hypothetical protein
MAEGNGTSKTFTATLARVNDNGLQIAERPGVWLNFSKFGDRPTIPPIGTMVRITLDARGFIRQLTPTDDEQPALPFAPERPARALTDITRLAIVKAAARFQASKPDATVDDLLITATALLAWVEDGAR